MPAVLVHGVPDTAELWAPLRAALTRDDVVTPALPGFGVPRPEGFGATKEDYASWLVDELVAIGEPVDLVGHDWGSILVQRVASMRPDLVRTLAFGSGPVDPEYVWHPMAQAWQTPDVGEQLVATAAETPIADRAELLAASGSPAALAASQSVHMDERMGHCILALYRSAVTVGAEWEPAIAAMPHLPALVLWGRDDPFVGPEYAERAAARVGGEAIVWDDTGHWWPWERATEAAAALEELWRRR